MKTEEKRFAVSPISLAVRGALFAMCAVSFAAYADDAADAEIKALISPTNSVEIGAMDVSSGSNKFGEYNGLRKSGGNLVGNVDVRGGSAFGKQGGTLRWSVYGTDLGTTSRSLGGSVENQGQWNLGLSFDQLRHYTTDGFQTPYQGSMGGNTFILPPSFGRINTTTPGARTLTATQLSNFHTEDVYSQRKNTKFTAGFNFNPSWNVKFDFNRLDQSGAKLMSAATDVFTGGPGGLNFGGERIAMLMNPTSYKTDTLKLALNWIGEKAHLSASYDGSVFHDDFSGVSFSNPWVAAGATGALVPGGAAFPINTMSTPPSNAFHQLSLTGGYRFGAATRLSGGISYGRNTQNESYAGTFTTTPNTMTAMPVSSLNGLVVTTHADLKVTHQASKALGLTAGFKYNERDNRTAANSYTFLDLGGAALTSVSTPMSNKRTQFELAGDYRISPSQRLHAGYEYESIRRWCSDPLSNNAQGAGAPVGYYTTASCAQVPKSTDNKLGLSYKLKATDTVDFNAGYAYSDRKSDVNPSFYNPMEARTTGYENFGYRAFFQASRTQDMFKAGVNWQAADRLSLGLNGRLTKDDYGSSPLGVQRGEASSINLDATYAYSDNSSVSVFTTWQDRSRDLLTSQTRNAVAPQVPANQWVNNLSDKDNTIGLSGKQKGLLGGKLELFEEFTYSLAKSRYSTSQLYTPVALGADGITPDIRSELTKFRLNGTYKLDKASNIVLGYTFQKLKSNDYFYNGYQYGFTATSMLPSNQQAPNYKVHVIFAAYKYTFQ